MQRLWDKSTVFLRKEVGGCSTKHHCKREKGGGRRREKVAERRRERKEKGEEGRRWQKGEGERKEKKGEGRRREKEEEGKLTEAPLRKCGGISANPILCLFGTQAKTTDPGKLPSRVPHLTFTFCLDTPACLALWHLFIRLPKCSHGW